MVLLEELLSNAQPNVAALENLKKDLLKARADSKLSQKNNFSALLGYAMYGEDRLKDRTLSDREIKGLKSEDLINKLKALAGMEHRFLYYGPIGEEELITAINKNHNVADKLTPVPEKTTYLPLETPINKVILAPFDAKQIYYMQISNRGEKFDVANDANMALYNEYFGSGMNSIVFQEMREARGLAYSASSYFRGPSSVEEPYVFNAFIATQNDKMGEAMDAFAEIINNMPRSQKAFQLAKDAILARLSSQRVTKMDVLFDYIALEELELAASRDAKIYEAIKDMTLEDVIAFQERWVKDRTYTYCVLGDGKDLDLDKLKSCGPITEVSTDEIFGY